MKVMATKWQTCIIEYVDMTFGQQIAVLIINTTAGIMNIITNGLLIYALWRLRKLKTASYRFIMYLSLSDFHLGILQLVIQALPYIHGQNKRDIIIIIMQFILYFFAPLSATMIMIIALDRYVHMRYLTYYNTVMTTPRSRLIVLCAVLLNITTAILITFSSLFNFYFIFHTILTVIYVVVIILTFFLYLGTYRSIRRRTADMTLARALSNKRTNANREFAKGMVFVLLALVVCYIPNYSLLLARSFINHAGKSASSLFLYYLLWAIIISYMNGIFNGIALILCNRQLRRFFANLLRISRADDSSTTPSVTT